MLIKSLGIVIICWQIRAQIPTGAYPSNMRNRVQLYPIFPLKITIIIIIKNIYSTDYFYVGNIVILQQKKRRVKEGNQGLLFQYQSLDYYLITYFL